MTDEQQSGPDGGPAETDAGEWTPARIPDLTGSVAVVTGANSGLGYATALELVRHGCHVVLACRDDVRGTQALQRLRAAARGAPGTAELLRLDLADLASIGDFAGRLTGARDRLDLLVNNAGVMAIPYRLSADGYELQLATNHLGPFALTGLVLPLLRNGQLVDGPARVVTVSSLMHRMGRLDRSDLMLQHGYSPNRAYARSKLANLLFALELQRRVDAAGIRLASLAAHPGFAATNLQAVGPAMAGNRWAGWAGSIGTRLFAQPAVRGAEPSLRAATDPQARAGEFFGPAGVGGLRGRPVRVTMSDRARDPHDAAWLWERSVELTGVDYPAPAGK